jgi:hypothetical protein
MASKGDQPSSPKPVEKPKAKESANVGARLHRSGYSEENVDGPQYLNTPWVKPDVLKAREKYRTLLFDQGEPLRNVSHVDSSVVLHGSPV